MLKQLPDSNSRFLSIRTENLVYIDKTRFIEKYENLKKSVSLFLRPRRFGKTLFTEILFYYYDHSLCELAQKLFKGTYIYNKPTSLKSSYGVLRFDFSGFQTNQDLISNDVKMVATIFKTKIVAGILDFYTRYPNYIPFYISDYAKERNIKPLVAIRSYYSQVEKFPTSSMIIEDFFLSLKENEFPYKLMLIIDEYDNFTNDILSKDKKRFIEIVNKQSEMGAFYSNIRSYHQEGIIDRVFITGILPITMDTLISGFVSSKISFDPNLNELAGFTDDEVLELLKETVDFKKSKYAAPYLMKLMKRRYNGYSFAKRAESKVYNSTLCLNFIQKFNDEFGTIPEMNISSNMDVDFNKLSGYLKLIKEDDRNDIFNAVCNDIPLGFSIPDSIKLDEIDNELDYSQGLALFYYLGFLTLMPEEEVSISFDKVYSTGLYLKVPNLYFKVLFTKYMLEQNKISLSRLVDKSNLVERMVKTNDLSGVVELLHMLQAGFVGTDITHENENTIVMTILCIIALKTNNAFELKKEYPIYHNQKIVSDALTEENRFQINRHRKADLVALNREDGPSYIFEFKYKRNENSSEETKAKVRAKLFNEACEQLKFYVTDDTLKNTKDLHQYVVLYTYGEFLLQEVSV